jgi:hypothetical protein
MDLRDGSQDRRLIWYRDEMIEHTYCKYRIIPNDFNFWRKIHIEVQSFNTRVMLIVVKEKGKFETSVFKNFKDGVDKVVLQKQPYSKLDNEEIWVVY